MEWKGVREKKMRVRSKVRSKLNPEYAPASLLRLYAMEYLTSDRSEMEIFEC